MLAIAVAIAALGMTCSDDDVSDGTTLPTPTVTAANGSTTALTTTTTSDRTSLPASTPAPSSTRPPTTSVGVLDPVPDGTPPAQPIDEQPSATGLMSVGFCDPNSPSNPAVTLAWVPEGSGAQLLAISTLPDGFETGRYTVTGEMAAGNAMYEISPIEPGGIYYWRLLTRSGDRWLSSLQESFTGPICVLDSP